MIEHKVENLQIERVDDIPLLIAFLYRMKVPQLLDEHFPGHGNWKGELSFGAVACVWLAYILSEGDHRLKHLESWVGQRRQMLEACLSAEVRGLDFQDDRLGWMLDNLNKTERFSEFEQSLNSQLLRVYQIKGKRVRVDMTTRKTYAGASEEGLFQYGHSSDKRPDLAQVKLGLASLDPLGLPLVTKVVSGNRADNGMYLPIIKETQKSVGRGGFTYIGDVKMDSVGVRGYLASKGDHYLCPLSQKQVGIQERERLIERGLSEDQKLEKVRGRGEKKAETIAVGYSYLEEQEAEVEGRRVVWKEQRVVVRSEGFARQQAAVIEKRVNRAEAQLLKLNERKRGKKKYNPAELEEEVGRILKEEKVVGLIRYRIEKEKKKVEKREEPSKRGVKKEEQGEAQVKVEVDQVAIKKAKARAGWRVYGTSHLEWSVSEVVTCYREQYIVERGFGRLKGKSLGLQPHYLRSEERVGGLLNLLVIGLRLLTLVEHQAREGLAEEEEEAAQNLKGLYQGQPQKKTARPTSESMLKAFKGVSVVYQEVSGEIYSYLTPLNDLQKRILRLLNISTYLYEGLAYNGHELNLILSET